MTWHLKDKDLERKFLLIDYEFCKKLNEACEQMDNNNDGDFPEYKPFAIVLDNGMTLFLNGGYVEETPDFDSKKWKLYPIAIPPEQQLLMFNGKDKYGRKYIGSAIFTHGRWLIPNTTGLLEEEETYNGLKLCESYLVEGLFKPWED